jgi:hypothetical protein
VQELWASVWKVVFYAGLSAFSALSVLVVVFGGYDLASLLISLRARHLERQARDLPKDDTAA